MELNQQLQTYALSEIELLKIHGRTAGSLDPLTLFWTGSALEMNVTGSELWVEIEADYELYEPWISILVNSAPVSRVMVTAGRYWLCIFRGMNPAAVKNIRIVKDVQAMSADPACSLQLHAVKADGEFKPVGDKPYKIEFIGDSITSGEGAIGSVHEEDWIPMWFSAIHNYTAMTAEALDADYRVISQSGWGVLTSWDNNPHGNIPGGYGKVCGLLTGAKNEALGAQKDNDFTAWQPDAVVVNLGTNDGGAFYSPGWKDEATGKTYKQRLNADGSFHEQDLAAFEEAAVRFLRQLRQYNRKAHIIWAYGMLGIPMLPAIRRAAQAYTKETGDRKVTVFQLPDMTPETAGARSHPGLEAHRQTARELAGYIRGIIGSGASL
ncbi:SGNH/GDSL hydrolase family protein [Paenibacillus tengchongensis]|uniref:SGNH/GDSL hydrolase family protein n=1 Tax=Paenibacillus tengchongensis TaxID=2608684 RepID=UPI00124E22AA|nr:SGNH/GDSL hydrolase family protein [Paenibacillus tengchongensis]